MKFIYLIMCSLLLLSCGHNDDVIDKNHTSICLWIDQDTTLMLKSQEPIVSIDNQDIVDVSLLRNEITIKGKKTGLAQISTEDKIDNISVLVRSILGIWKVKKLQSISIKCDDQQAKNVIESHIHDYFLSIRENCRYEFVDEHIYIMYDKNGECKGNYTFCDFLLELNPLLNKMQQKINIIPLSQSYLYAQYDITDYIKQEYPNFLIKEVLVTEAWVSLAQ